MLRYKDLPECQSICGLCVYCSNRQAYGFVIHDGAISLVRRPDEYTTEIDGKLSLGIVLLHFTSVAENWAGKLRWSFAEHAAKLQLPEGHEVIATCVL